MAERTTNRYVRVYADGYDLSGYATDVGTLDAESDYASIACMSDEIKGGLCAALTAKIGTLNGVFDNTATSGLHVVANSPAQRNIMVAIGKLAAPAVGDPAFVGKWAQTGYHAITSGVMVTVSIPFGGWDANSLVNYRNPWGNIVHAYGAETGANGSNTPNVDGGAETTAGGYMAYQIFGYSGTGSATISIDDSANGTSWLALSGATTGAIAHTSMPCAGIVQLGTTATVRRYLRWQLSLSTLTSVTFALAFVRG